MTRIDLHREEGGEAPPRARSALADAGEGHYLSSEEMKLWLQAHGDAIADRWLAEIRSRSEGLGGEEVELLSEFVQLLTSFLAPSLGVHREAVEHLFQEAATLFGNLGAYRGGAAGESVEEFQLLREVLLRTLYAHPPGEKRPALPGLRDLLQLNRLIDLGVTYTSVGHADTLFFNLFRRTGVQGAPASNLYEKVREEISGIQEELVALIVQGSGERAERLN